jgi:hypothetical protein
MRRRRSVPIGGGLPPARLCVASTHCGLKKKGQRCPNSPRRALAKLRESSMELLQRWLELNHYPNKPNHYSQQLIYSFLQLI